MVYRLSTNGLSTQAPRLHWKVHAIAEERIAAKIRGCEMNIAICADKGMRELVEQQINLSNAADKQQLCG